MSRQDLPPDLTFEEFKVLANREPSLEGQWIYKVTQAMWKHYYNYYPTFNLYDPKQLYFLSFDDAESFIKKNEDSGIYCSWITQIPIANINEYDGFKWLYDNKGELVDYTSTSPCSQGLSGYFFGRPENRRRFKKGDIVEVISENQKEVKLAVVDEVVPDVKECWEKYQKSITTCPPESGNTGNLKKCSYDLNWLEERLIVLFGPNSWDSRWISPLSVLKPRYKISDDIKAELQTWSELFKKAKGYGFNIQPRMDLSHFLGWGAWVECFYNFKVNIWFDNDDKFYIMLDDDYGGRVSLRTDKPEYADYPGFTDRLSTSQLKALQDYFEEKICGKSRWWHIIRDYNDSDSNEELPYIPYDLPIPDYTTLI